LSSEEKNVIHSDKSDRHVIMKYDFKTIDPSDVVDGEHGKVDRNLVQDIEEKRELQKGIGEAASVQTQHIQQSAPPQPTMHSMPSAIDKELIDKLLSKHDELAQTLMNLQSDLKQQQNEFDEKLKTERERAFNDGFEKGSRETKENLERSVDDVKKGFLESIETIGKESEGFEQKIESIEKELSAIATDIAKEIIVVEIKERGKDVAAALSKALMENLKEATKIKIKVNPNDFEFVKGELAEDTRVKVEADKAIARGGVVLLSDKGNIDGNIMSRYQALKRSILEAN